MFIFLHSGYKRKCVFLRGMVKEKKEQTDCFLINSLYQGIYVLLQNTI